MIKVVKISLYIIFAGLLSFSFFIGEVKAATVEFTADTELSITGGSPTLYINTGSACDTLTISGTTLETDVPSGSTFTLGTASRTVLALTPSGGTTTLSFDTTYYTCGYVTQWVASSSVSSATTSFSVGGIANEDYTVSVDGSELGSYRTNGSGVMTFSYTGGYSAKTFTVVVQESSASSQGFGSDVLPPVISDIEIIEGKNQADISWETNESSISWIFYGTSTDYGLEVEDANFSLSHSLTLSDLIPETTYHYQIKSEDKYSNTSVLEDKVFTTLSETQEEPVEIPVSEMTIEEMKAEISRITNLIIELQRQLVELGQPSSYVSIPSGFTFERNLAHGEISDDVKYLQVILKREIGSPVYPDHVEATGYFGDITKASVIKLQEKYSSEVLLPLNLDEGTGYFGPSTRGMANKLLK